MENPFENITLDLTAIYFALVHQMELCFQRLDSITIRFIGADFTLLQVVMGALASSIIVTLMTAFRNRFVADNEVFDDDDNIEMGDD